MRAPLARSLDEVDIGLIGVPTDLGVTNRPGARHGPREIRNASSLMRTFNLGLGVNPYDLCRIADLGDVRFSQPLRSPEAGPGDRGVLSEGARGRCAAGHRGRRSFDHLSHIQSDRRQGAHRDGAHRCAHRHLGRVRRLQVSSWRAFPAGGGGGLARPAADHSDRHPRRPELHGGDRVLARDGHAGGLHRRVRIPRCRASHRGSAQGGGLRSHVHLVRCGRTRPGLCARDRDAGDRWHHDAGGAAAPARTARTQSHRRRCRGGRAPV